MNEKGDDREIACEVRSYLAGQHMWPGLAGVDVHVEDGFVTVDFEGDHVDPVIASTLALERAAEWSPDHE